MIRQRNVDNGEPDAPISVLLEDKGTAWWMITNASGKFFGPFIGGLVYESTDDSAPTTGLIKSIICAVLVVIYLILVYGFFNDGRIRDYYTLDGLRKSHNQKELAKDM